MGFALAVFAAGPARGQTDAAVPALTEPDFLLSVGSLVDPAGMDSAAVLGAEKESATRGQILTASDRLYVPAVVGGGPLIVGDWVQMFRITRTIRDPLTDEPLGRLLLPTGVGQVDSLAGATVRVRVSDAYHPILIGDRVRAITEGDTTLATAAAGWMGPAEGQILAFQQEKAIHPPFDILFLAQPQDGALAPGEVVLLYRPGPAVEGLQLPEEIIGRAMVVRPQGRVAAAVVTESYRSDLAVGDRYRREAPPP